MMAELACVHYEQPIIVDGYPVSFWEAVSEVGNEWTSVAEIAELLLELHKLVAPDNLHLPEVAPFAKAEERISANTWLTPEKRSVLTDKLAELRHREWDLILTAVYYDSFGWHTTEEYEEFARAYGFDIMKWSGYSTLKELSEFLMVTWVITKAAQSRQVADEASKRIESIRTGASRKDWAPL
jgi:hypothetical protein